MTEAQAHGAVGGELEALRHRVAELESTLAAIHSGEVDALIVKDSRGHEQLFTLSGPDTPYQVFVDHMGEGALTVDRSGIIVYCNSRFAQLAGLPLERVVGMNFEEFLPQESAPCFRELLSARSGTCEIELRRSDGNTLPIRCSSNSVGGEADSCWLVVTELGVQKHIEQLQALIGTLIEAMAQPHIEGALRVLTERACAIIGAHHGMTTALQGPDWSRADTAEFRSAKLAGLARRGAAPVDEELYRLVCDGNRPLRMTQAELEAHPAWRTYTGKVDRPPMRGWLAAPLIAADGSNLGIAQLTDKIVGNFTEHDELMVLHIAQMAASVVQTKRAESALLQSEQRFRQLADTIPQLAWMAHPDGGIYWYNRRWYEYTGTTPEEMTGWGWQSVHDPERLPHVLERWRECIAHGTPFDMEFPIRGADGEFRPFFTLIRPLRDEHGRIVQWFGTNTDVSAQHRLMQDRNQLLEAERAARTEAERTSRMKDEFVATLSHELRTPLNAILGWSYMIARGDVTGVDLKRGLETIERNARAQVQMIEDLLDMSRIISGKLRLDVQDVELSGIVDAALATIRPAAEAKRITVSSRVAGRAHVRGDPHRLQQVVWNLLSNAVKFTDKGGHVAVAMDRDESFHELRVQDDGIGISAEFLPQVFERFRQADGSTTRSYSGLGLGLSIVKQLVELHGGTVDVSSSGTGEGATFVVRLPRTERESAPATSATSSRASVANGAATALAGLTLLYVDDEPDARVVTARILSDFGATVVTAQSAAEGRELAAQIRPDLLLSDIGMPQEDGYSLIRSIRALPLDEGGALPAIAVTALARPEDHQRALSAGFQSHLAKPLQARDLLSAVARLTGRALA